MQFQKLPHEVNRIIGSFLDYPSRMEFSRVLTDREDRFVRKLDSDAHNYFVVVDKLKRRLTNKPCILFKFYDYIEHIYDTYYYLANTKDTILLDVVSDKPNSSIAHFRRTVIEKALDYADPDCPEYNLLTPYEFKERMMDIAMKVAIRYQTHVPKKPIHVKRKLITIV